MKFKLTMSAEDAAVVMEMYDNGELDDLEPDAFAREARPEGTITTEKSQGVEKRDHPESPSDRMSMIAAIFGTRETYFAVNTVHPAKIYDVTGYGVFLEVDCTGFQKYVSPDFLAMADLPPVEYPQHRRGNPFEKWVVGETIVVKVLRTRDVDGDDNAIRLLVGYVSDDVGDGDSD